MSAETARAFLAGCKRKDLGAKKGVEHIQWSKAGKVVAMGEREYGKRVDIWLRSHDHNMQGQEHFTGPDAASMWLLGR